MAESVGTALQIGVNHTIGSNDITSEIHAVAGNGHLWGLGIILEVIRTANNQPSAVHACPIG